MNNSYLKPKCLKRGDKVAIISSSRGTIGEKFASHEVEIGVKRLENYGLVPVFMPNSMKGIEYLSNHPEDRAKDFKNAFLDDSINAIITAIGGVDTYKIIPYLIKDKEFIHILKKKPKIFTGYGDATINHLMLFKLGIVSFYGPNFLCDLAEFGDGMLEYTRIYFEKYFDCPDELEIISSDVWYKDRTDFGKEQVKINRKPYKEKHRYEVLYGEGKVSGILLGGCLDAIYEAYTGTRFEEEKAILENIGVLPTEDDWKGKIMFFDTCEHKVEPEELLKMLNKLDEIRIFDELSGIIIAKPMDEVYYNEYKNVYKEFFSKKCIPTLYNLNFGHSAPRCFIPYGIMSEIDLDEKTFKLLENPLILRETSEKLV